VNKYQQIGADTGKLVAEKQEAYGDSFGRSGAVLREMYPDGIKPDQYDDLLTVARVLDKLFRIANDKGAFDENPWRDIVGYGLLGMARDDGDAEEGPVYFEHDHPWVDPAPPAAPQHVKEGYKRAEGDLTPPEGHKENTRSFDIAVETETGMYRAIGGAMWDGVALDFTVRKWWSPDDLNKGLEYPRLGSPPPRLDRAISDHLVREMQEGLW